VSAGGTGRPAARSPEHGSRRFVVATGSTPGRREQRALSGDRGAGRSSPRGSGGQDRRQTPLQLPGADRRAGSTVGAECWTIPVTSTNSGRGVPSDAIRSIPVPPGIEKSENTTVKWRCASNSRAGATSSASSTSQPARRSMWASTRRETVSSSTTRAHRSPPSREPLKAAVTTASPPPGPPAGTHARSGSAGRPACLPQYAGRPAREHRLRRDARGPVRPALRRRFRASSGSGPRAAAVAGGDGTSGELREGRQSVGRAAGCQGSIDRAPRTPGRCSWSTHELWPPSRK
jgi:hypothetical protein